MASYLVTGGCGFIGSHLADALQARGDRVVVLDDLSSGSRDNLPPGVELRLGCITDRAAVSSALRDVDGCFHLAAIASVEKSNQEWYWTHQVNLGGTVNILDAASMAKPSVPVVYASSAAVYGDLGRNLADEDALPMPRTAYGCDKAGCEMNARIVGSNRGLPTCGLRFFNVYGPRQDPSSPYSGVISVFADRLRQSQGLNIYGDGEQVRDFVHVSDVVRALLAAMGAAAPSAPVVNVCTAQPTSILGLAGIMMDVMGCEVPITHANARLGDIRYSRGSPAKADRVLDWRAETQLRDGLTLLLGR